MKGSLWRDETDYEWPPSGRPCQAHDWPTPGLGERLKEALRVSSSKRCFTVCVPCIRRARGGPCEGCYGTGKTLGAALGCPRCLGAGRVFSIDQPV